MMRVDKDSSSYAMESNILKDFFILFEIRRMFTIVGCITGRLRRVKNVTGRLKEVGQISVKRLEEVTWRIRKVGHILVQGVEDITEWLMETRHVPMMKPEEVPEALREPGIITGYRHENCSIIQATASLFKATNETVNFWTHFLANLYFMWLLISFSSIMPMFEESYLFAFFLYMIAACGYLLMSCLAHAFSCLSETATHVCFFVDYLGIAMYSWAVAYLYYSYSFPPLLMNTWFSHTFLPVAAFNTVFATVCASLSRFCQTPLLQKLLRVGAFMVPYIWDSFPLVVFLYNCDANDSCTESHIHHLNQFICVILACFFYGSHIPEILAPGHFDYLGNSHNLLHVFSILGTNEQMKAVLIDLKTRKGALEVINWLPSSSWATQATPIILACNVFIVLILSYYISKQKNYSHHGCSQKVSLE